MIKLSAFIAFAVAVLSVATASAANAVLTTVTVDRMTQACFAYAKSHRGAVNIWIYSPDGEVIRYERMDGAPAIASPPGVAFGSVINPNSLAPADPGDTAIAIGGQNFGRVRVAGLGSAGDRACAEAAVAAAK